MSIPAVRVFLCVARRGDAVVVGWSERSVIAEAGRAELLVAAAAIVAVSAESDGSVLAQHVLAVLLDVAAGLREAAHEAGR
jgi:hypothetical protein